MPILIGHTSTNTGFAPWWIIALIVEKKVRDGAIRCNSHNDIEKAITTYHNDNNHLQNIRENNIKYLNGHENSSKVFVDKLEELIAKHKSAP